eukprot:CAMPEP_0118645492 /NCGR_PEP_ID=MMETSP0785-20121206/7535_1 /TAXON_ID=91992 /ORGANISM="Bolidomonas pacifica, Strain CCMP 1866" /LENGTH=414 /DNA_ID=CAMNT_0006537389 /DNA_START=168 /DNA_END=1409 /DNA_ORIENTATION=+
MLPLLSRLLHTRLPPTTTHKVLRPFSSSTTSSTTSTITSTGFRTWRSTTSPPSTTSSSSSSPSSSDGKTIEEDNNNSNNNNTQKDNERFERDLQSVLSDSGKSIYNKYPSLGVVRREKSEDLRLMVSNYTTPALAGALRDREDTLQLAAALLRSGDMDSLRSVLSPHEAQYIEIRRRRRVHLDLQHGFSTRTLEMLRKYLARMPRQVTKAHRQRAAIVLPLCNVDGIPSVLFEKRSEQMRKHPGEVCFPGGMVSEGDDHTIVSTCLREMEEEVGLTEDATNVLGILRCNWGEISAITGIAVTPVVGYVGTLGEGSLEPNPQEVEECFTVPLADVLKKQNWVSRDGQAPIFTGGPHVVWGLTAYILDRFKQDVLARYRISFKSEEGEEGKSNGIEHLVPLGGTGSIKEREGFKKA